MSRLGLIRAIFRPTFLRTWTKRTYNHTADYKPYLARPARCLLSCRTLPVLSRLCKQTCFDHLQARYTSVAATNEKMSEKKKFERLPKNVVPSNYNLRLQPDLAAFTFTGSEEIDVEVKNALKTITLNSVEIAIQKATYRPGSGSELTGEVSFDKEEELAIISFPSALQPGKGVLRLEFTGELNDKMKGFYRSKYTTPGGEERFAAVTQFEATDARRAFPCWDEPAVKATFDVTLIGPKDRVILSNMPVVTETPLESDKSQKVLTFKRTPVMSTYLLAFVVGEFDYVEGKDTDGVLIRVYTPSGKKEQGQYALEVAIKTLPFYKDYFGIAYPLPKMDLIAIADFSAGAMENWGLVTYRETALLVDPQNTSTRVKLWVSLVVGHELAHQWFGNLVTMEWWTHLWLNEGFASWIEYLCVDHCFPEYDIWTQFVSNDLSRALKLDALESSHPIEMEVSNPAEVDEIFDAISYSKGASVINMLHDYIGDDDFRKGLTLYLQRHQYSSACTEDLWRALEQASGKPVGSIMDTWTSQKGFPVLKVTEKQAEGEGLARVLEITQQKYSIAAGQMSDKEQMWIVPVGILTASGEKKKVLMEGRTMTVPLNGPLDEWVKVNAGTKGVYRVQYSTDMLMKLVPCIQEQLLAPTDRLGIISDLFSLCEAGLVSTVEVLNLVRAFTGESNFTVWNVLMTNLSQTGRILEYNSYTACSLFHEFLCSLLGKVYSRLGWEEDSANEDHMVSKLRELVVSFLGVCGAKPVLERALAAFESHVEGRGAIPSNLRRAVYATVMANGNMEHYTKLKKLHETSESAEEKSAITCSFGCSQDPGILEDALRFALSGAVKSQDSPVVIGRISMGSAMGRELAWTFFKDNYQQLYQRYSSNLLLARLVKTSTEDFASEEKAVEIEEFFQKHPVPSAERTVQQSCEKVRANARWLQREADNIAKYLQENPLPRPVYQGLNEEADRKPFKTAANSAQAQARFSGIVVKLPDK